MRIWVVFIFVKSNPTHESLAWNYGKLFVHIIYGNLQFLKGKQSWERLMRHDMRTLKIVQQTAHLEMIKWNLLSKRLLHFEKLIFSFVATIEAKILHAPLYVMRIDFKSMISMLRT